MSVCKYCKKEINWNKEGERSIPINPDGTRHDCRKREDAKPYVPQKHIGFQEAEEIMAQKEAERAQVKPTETCTSPKVPDATPPEDTQDLGEVISVTIGSTISLGNYSNIHLEVVATDAVTARLHFKEEIAETVRMVRGIIKEVGA